jgi:transcriptional regulator with XRE-family HTH domain
MGRSRKSDEAKKADLAARRRKRARGPGNRLSKALQEFGFSQTQAAVRTQIPQGKISAIISGERPISADELTAIGKKLGIPPDYILGLTDTLIRLGESRPRAELAADVARFVANDADLSSLSKSVADVARGDIDGEALLRFLVKAQTNELMSEAAAYEAMIAMADLMNAMSPAEADHLKDAASIAAKYLFESRPLGPIAAVRGSPSGFRSWYEIRQVGLMRVAFVKRKKNGPG